MKKIIGFNYKYKSQEKERSELIKEIGFDGVFIYSQYNPQNYIEDILPPSYLHINISKDLSKGENYRKISIIPYGERYGYIKELEK